MRIKEGRLYFLTLLVACFVCCFLSLSLISASSSFRFANYSIEKNYAYSGNLKGWINLSLNDMPFNSQFTFNGFHIGVLDLLKKSLSPNEYNCSSSGCEMEYSATGSAFEKEAFDLNYQDSKILGFKIQADSFDRVNNLLMNLSSNAGESCNAPLSADVLDDGVIDWVSYGSSDSFCPRMNGCYSSSSQKTKIESGTEYCELFKGVRPFPNLYAGFQIYGSNQALFIMHVFDADGEGTFDKTCQINLESIGSPALREAKCSLNSSMPVEANLTLCLTLSSDKDYSLYYEDNAPVCGYVDEYAHDFSLFLDPSKYGAVNSVFLNSSKLLDIDFQGYMDEKYSNDCSGGCFIPIKLYSGMNFQNININSVALDYRADGLQNTLETMFNLNTTASTIDMGLRRVLLDNSGLLVPASAGNYNLPLYLNGELVTRFNITVLSLPVIQSVFPTEVPAGAPITFTAVTNAGNATAYVWDFGDNSSLVSTTTNKAEHTYLKIGAYKIVLNVSNQKGTSSKDFDINAVNPEGYINRTFISLNNKFSLISNQINSLPAVAAQFIRASLNLSNLEANLQNARVKYTNALGDAEENIEVMQTLAQLNIPNSINITSSDSGTFIFNVEQINIADLKTITTEDSSASDEELKKAIFDWYMKNLAVTLNLKTYSAIYDKQVGVLGTLVSMNINPLTSQNQVYLLINKPLETIHGLSNIGSVSGSQNSYIMLDLSSQMQKDFIVLDKMKIVDLPVYFSPLLSRLEVLSNISACNYNNICEKDAGEDSSNCQADCKPWIKTTLYIILVLFFIFVLYIIIQEWYKRKYENYLFKDKNELYNLINFMDNAEKQGFKREDIIKKLREKNWSNEKLVYAYKKYKGERTGMIEIPVFRFIEKRKVNEELAKRRQNPAINAQFGRNFANLK